MKRCIKAYFITLELVGLRTYRTSLTELNNGQIQLITQLMQLVKVSLQRMLHDNSEQHSDERN